MDCLLYTNFLISRALLIATKGRISQFYQNPKTLLGGTKADAVLWCFKRGYHSRFVDNLIEHQIAEGLDLYRMNFTLHQGRVTHILGYY
jgi:hypothetical protein